MKINNVLKERTNLLSKLLCFVLTDIMKNVPKTYSRLIKNKELNKWWTAHMIADKKQAEKEKQLILESKIKKSLKNLEIKIRKNPNKYYNEK